MLRGGHLEVWVLGAFQVAAWMQTFVGQRERAAISRQRTAIHMLGPSATLFGSPQSAALKQCLSALH